MIVKTRLQHSNYFSLPGLKGEGIFPKQKVMKQKIIIEEACRYFKVSMPQLSERCRKRYLVEARQVIIYLLCKHTAMTLKEIGALFLFDHTTVIHSRQTIKDLLETEEKIKRDITQIEYLIL